jgi:conjugative transfer signal peptidase TraF
MKLILAIGLIVAFSLPSLMTKSSLIFNGTDSVPVGLYNRAPNGTYAVFCLPIGAARGAIVAGLQIQSGPCPGGIQELMKPLVQASPARPVVFGPAGFTVDGKLLPNTAPKTTSRSGHALEHFPFGNYTSGRWPVSSFNRDSFDARYYGPISANQIRFYASPIWTW